jgi:diaminopimelate decarboxylase
VNLDIPISGAALAMGGGATPFGMDPDSVNECLGLLAGQDAIKLHGIHARLASGLDAPRMVELAAAVLDYARGLGLSEVNLGGGMAVNYADPDQRFDWKTYGAGLAQLRRPGEVLRIEPGRSITVYCGRYVTRVIDVKRVHGELFAIVAGGTHHIRTPSHLSGSHGWLARAHPTPGQQARDWPATLRPDKTGCLGTKPLGIPTDRLWFRFPQQKHPAGHLKVAR